MAEFMTETAARPPGARRTADTARPGVPQPAGAPPPPRAAACRDDPAAASGALPAGGDDGHDAPAILDRARRSVDPELRQAVASLPTAMRRIARHHFGWEHADGSTAAGNAGKAIRPALVLAAAAALGGPPARADAARAAAAVELVHNFTLLHDDVMDRDAARRHRPTAWALFGDADALLAGDAVQALALRTLAEDRHSAARSAMARLTTCVIELCEGQRADTALERRPLDEVTLAEVLAMAEAKTGALLGCACALGALYAGADAEKTEALDAFGRQAGLAFQLIDDVIDIWGDPARTGKPARADLVARKKSLPVVAALTSGAPAARELAEIYARPHTQGEEEHAALLVERAGGRDWAQSEAADRMAQAVQELSRAVPDPAAADELLTLAEFVTRRTA
ncbi:family 2 encapsulin nanocompartment cargo protein polyprenyl transferase [Streptomyces sp. NPDC046985]|uniref:family 2 encapsulin nanocompartment cargo protein polyprenyl transferase n=1 Tax=Streptomyces sp. NPDC046985 TaxID=3155377 RepID=UPI00340FC6E3